MAFAFVIETQDRRNLNRNNHRLIQQRATKVGAQTRRSRWQSRARKLSSNAYRHATHPDSETESDESEALLRNAFLSWSQNSSFLLQFGGNGVVIQMAVPDPADSSPFTPLQLRLKSVVAFEHFATDPNRWAKVFKLSTWEVLQFMLSHYGHTRVLDRAIECLVLRLQEYATVFSGFSARVGRLQVPTPGPQTRLLYGQALHALQSAISAIPLQNVSEVWYATILLTLFELLGSREDKGWVAHAQGAFEMLAAVGPSAIRTGFHEALLGSQARIMITETLLTNQSCFLSQPKWQKVLARALETSLAVEYQRLKPATLSLTLLGAHLPTVFKRVTNFLLGTETHQPHELELNLRDLSAQYEVWKEDWEKDVLALSETRVQTESEMRAARELLAIHTSHVAMISRLSIAVKPYEKIKLEKENSLKSSSVFGLYDYVHGNSIPLRLVGQFVVVTADSIRSTTDEWVEHIQRAHPDRPLKASVFVKWSNLLGRKI